MSEGSDEPKSTKIFPRNLTARAAYQVVGNPDISRPEDSVGNCFPGLDLDVRNLDRRFFPGLVFDFVWEAQPPEPDRFGALLMYPDGYGDNDLRPEYLDHLHDDDDPVEIDGLRRALYRRLVGDDGQTLAKGDWYLDWVQQKNSKVFMDRDGVPLDGQIVWRIVRGLEPGRLTIGLRRRDAVKPGERQTMTFEGWRRRFTSPKTGVISSAYQPGELLMSMCSPWQHDFRDCACHYWASNRPDVVHGEVAMPTGTPSRDAGSKAVSIAARLIDWMRADRSPSAASASLGTMEANRPFQMDHFQINRSWQELNIVIGNAEIGDVLVPPPLKVPPQIFSSTRELIRALKKLARLEMTLALEYLYASFSLFPDLTQATQDLAVVERDAGRVRQELLTIAVGEMQHLRWANQLVWTLMKGEGEIDRYRPVLEPTNKVPLSGGRRRKAKLRPLTARALQDFIDGEAPSGGVDGQYMRVIATLALDKFPPELRELASLIVADGVEHHVHFQNVKIMMAPYLARREKVFPRPLKPGTDDKAREASGVFQVIMSKLGNGYMALANGRVKAGAAALASAHDDMKTLLKLGEELAADNHGIPFWK